MNHRIIIVTLGSLGDLHPYMAIGQALRELNVDPVFAVSAMHLEKLHAAGFEAYDFSGDYRDFMTTLNLTEAEIVMRIMKDVDFIFSKILLPTLEDSVKKLEDIAKGATAMLAHPLAFAANIVAEKHDIPYIAGVLQPSLFLSAYDPVVSPQAPLFMQQPKHKISIGWNKFLFSAAQAGARIRYGRKINQVRNNHGLPSSTTAPMFDPETIRLTLGLYSSVIGDTQPDYPSNTFLTGFPVFDSNSGIPETLDTEFQSFLSSGPPPLVFTLGSFAIYAGEQFYEDSRKLAQSLNRRAILLTGVETDFETTDTLIVRPYAPHSQVFPHCASIIHHGGIGTTGQALKAGKPQLIVPHLGDQWDNGARIKRIGVGDVLDAKKYTQHSAAAKIMNLLNTPAIENNARNVGNVVRKENGALNSAQKIAAMLSNKL